MRRLKPNPGPRGGVIQDVRFVTTRVDGCHTSGVKTLGVSALLDRAEELLGGGVEGRELLKMRGRGGSSGSSLEAKSVLIARAFFHAATKLSDEDEDILPQEDGDENKLSVYYLFSELFPEHVVAKVLL